MNLPLRYIARVLLYGTLIGIWSVGLFWLLSRLVGMSTYSVVFIVGGTNSLLLTWLFNKRPLL